MGAYNTAAPGYALQGVRPDALAVVVGSGRELWEPFLVWLRPRLFPSASAPTAVDDAGTSANPLDEYVMACVQAVLAALDVRAAVYWGHDLRPDRMVELQRAAHESGALAHDGRHSNLCFHESVGSWCSLSALLVFNDVDGPASTPARARLPAEATLLELAALMRKALDVQGTNSPSDTLTPAAAEAWVKFRCAAGVSHAHAAFESLQVRYLVTKDRRLLRQAVEERWPEHRGAAVPVEAGLRQDRLHVV